MSDKPPTTTDAESGTESLVSEIGRYDIVLLVIPLVFLTGLIVSFFLTVSLEAVMVGASVVAIAALADALFLHPPTEAETSEVPFRDERPEQTTQTTQAQQAD